MYLLDLIMLFILVPALFNRILYRSNYVIGCSVNATIEIAAQRATP